MKEQTVIHYVKRTPKDYTMSFKLQVVGEVERGERTIGSAGPKDGAEVLRILREVDSSLRSWNSILLRGL